MTKQNKRPTRRTRAKYENGAGVTIESRLLSAMERLLANGDRFGNVTVEQLMEEAGMARASFYLHFRDRGELVTRLMEQVRDELSESIGKWFANAAEAERSDLDVALAGMVNTFKKHQVILTAISDLAPQDEAVARLYEEMVSAISAQSKKSLRTIKRQGRSRSGATDEVAEILTWMITLYCVRFIDRYDGVALDRLGRNIGYIAGCVAFSDSA